MFQNVRNISRKYGPQVAVVGAVLVPVLAHATDPADALTALQTFSGTTTAYGPVLFGLAVVSTGIMLGIAWIKKARGAGR
jgi:Ca2+/Na+ antiporter